jgi:hypothetical protein
MIVRWNLTGRRDRHLGRHALVLSIGKSGRTWLRVLLNKFLSLHYKVPFELGDLNKYDTEVPSIGYDHELWKHFSEAKVGGRIKGLYLIPPDTLLSKKVVLLFRDPRDVVVSLYFQKTKRSHNKVALSMGDFLRHNKYGIRNIIRVLNEWRRRLKDHPQCLWLSYEAMKADTAGELARVVDFIGIKGADAGQIKEAVDFSRFENMKKMEARGEFQKQSLRPGDPKDADSFKVREGKVGGYKRHFSEKDLEYIEQTMRSLDKFYMYKNETPG